MTKLYAAIDIIDDIRSCGFFPDKRHLTALMKYLRRLNIRRLEWIMNDWMDIHLAYPHGFDLELIDRGVDGINIRPTSHYHPTDYRDYGFNPPVLEACHGEVDWPAAAGFIGDAFTRFLREARDLLHAHGKELGVHLMNSDYFERLPALPVWTNVPPGIGRNWRTWVREIADYAEYRVGVGNNPAAMAATIDPVAELCRKSRKSLIYQGKPGLLRPSTMFRDSESMAHQRARLDNLAGEIALVRSRPGIAAYLLYEVHAFTLFERDGGIRGCEEVENVLRRSGLSDQAAEMKDPGKSE